MNGEGPCLSVIGLPGTTADAVIVQEKTRLGVWNSQRVMVDVE